MHEELPDELIAWRSVAGEDVMQVVDLHRSTSPIGVGERHRDRAELEIDPLRFVTATGRKTVGLEVELARLG